MAEPSERRRGGPCTPEGKARSAMNALRHGLRAARFALLPHEDAEAFRALVAGLRRAHAPADAVELLYVDAIAVAIWRELRADRLEAEAMADIAPAEPGRSCGSDLAEPAARASLATVARYRAAAQAEHRRALRLLEEHRRLRADVLARDPGYDAEAADELPPADPEPPEPARIAARERPRAAPALRDRLRLLEGGLAGLAGEPEDLVASALEAVDPAALERRPGAAATAAGPAADPVAETRAWLADWLDREPAGVLPTAGRRAG